MSATVKNDDGNLERKFVVSQIRRFRKMLEQDIDKDLKDVMISAYWLLYDICDHLDFTPKETHIALG